MFVLRDAGWCFRLYSNSNRAFCRQTVKNLIRRRDMRRLVRFCAVCLHPIIRRLRLCCALLYVHSSIAIILMGERELVALLNLSSWCLVVVERLFLAVPWGCLRFVIVVFPDHTRFLFLYGLRNVHSIEKTCSRYKISTNRKCFPVICVCYDLYESV